MEIAQRIEQGEWLIYEALCENPVVLRELLRLNEMAAKDQAHPARAGGRRSDEPLESKAADRIKGNLKIFEQIAANDHEIGELRKRQKRCKPDGEKYLEIEREIDRLVAKIAKDIRTVDFSVQTRKPAGGLPEGHRQAVHPLRAGHQAGRRRPSSVETNEELKALHRRRIEKYRGHLRELEERYGTTHAGDRRHDQQDPAGRGGVRAGQGGIDSGQPPAGGLDRQEVHQPRFCSSSISSRRGTSA